MSARDEDEADDDNGMQHIMGPLEADKEVCEAVVAVDREIISLVRQLGGSSRGYRRERAKQTKQLVAEIYSAPPRHEGPQVAAPPEVAGRIRVGHHHGG